VRVALNPYDRRAARPGEETLLYRRWLLDSNLDRTRNTLEGWLLQ
jgi:hypothetical protein